jgi:DNA-directed RNA polymerase specialized sigma24 family protein
VERLPTARHNTGSHVAGTAHSSRKCALMNPPRSPPPDLVELHQVMLNLQQTHQPEARTRLANQMVGHAALGPKLVLACAVVLGHHASDSDLLDDVRQEASLRLIERFRADNLAYRDEGADRFGGWIYKVCKTACADALKACGRLWFRSIVLPGMGQMEAYPARAEGERLIDKVLRAIDAIPDPQVREIMLEYFAGDKVAVSAIRHGVSNATISRRRKAGIQFVYEYVGKDFADAL